MPNSPAIPAGANAAANTELAYRNRPANFLVLSVVPREL
jgi:hypothetical protein